MQVPTPRDHLIQCLTFCLRIMEWYEKNENNERCPEEYRGLSQLFLGVAPTVIDLTLFIFIHEDESIEWKLISIVKQLKAAIEMQLKRESGEFHIPQPSAKIIWNRALTDAKKML